MRLAREDMRDVARQPGGRVTTDKGKTMTAVSRALAVIAGASLLLLMALGGQAFATSRRRR
jgi:hypothetical protein